MVKLMYTAGKISMCPDWKITCPVGHVTTKVYVPWDKIYMPRAYLAYDFVPSLDETTQLS